MCISCFIDIHKPKILDNRAKEGNLWDLTKLTWHGKWWEEVQYERPLRSLAGWLAGQDL